MDYFEKLTGLHFLNLWDQPLESVDGIQNLRELHDLGLAFCDNLTDISPVFALQNLHSLWLRICTVSGLTALILRVFREYRT